MKLRTSDRPAAAHSAAWNPLGDPPEDPGPHFENHCSLPRSSPPSQASSPSLFPRRH